LKALFPAARCKVRYSSNLHQSAVLPI